MVSQIIWDPHSSFPVHKNHTVIFHLSQCWPSTSLNHPCFSIVSNVRMLRKLMRTSVTNINESCSVQFSSVTQLCPTLCNHMNRSTPGLAVHHPTPGVHPNPCPLSQWCHPTISSSVVPFSCPQSFQASGSFQMSQLFASGGQSIGVSASASVLPMNIQDWFRLGWTGWISLQFKGLSRVFSNTTFQKHQFFSSQLSS